MSALGYSMAFFSAIFNGSWPVLSKISIVSDTDIHPLLFNFYFATGVLISSLFSIPFFPYDFIFTFWGMISGLLLNLAVVFSLAAVPRAGISIAQGVWSGTAILSSFIFGTLFIDGAPNKIGLSIGALFVLGVGVFGVAFSSQIGKWLPKLPSDEEEDSFTSSVKRNGIPVDELRPQRRTSEPEDEVGIADIIASRSEGVSVNQREKFYGVCCALLVGLFGGTVLLPVNWAPTKSKGVRFLPSFGTGVFIIALIIVILYYIHFYYIQKINQRDDYQPTRTASTDYLVRAPFSDLNPYSLYPSWHWKQTLIPGLLAGVVWNFANICSIYGIDELGYAVAYPMMQCALLVAALWGVFFFKEMSGRPVVVLFIAGFILLGGAAMLAIAK